LVAEALFSPEDRTSLWQAIEALESPRWIIRVANTLGMPVEKLLGAMPKKLSGFVRDATRAALFKALKVAVYKLNGTESQNPAGRRYKVSVGVTGAIGGFFGLPALAVELPISTTIMLRSIAAIAQAAGEDLSSPEARLACLQVFALGGSTRKDDSAETAYYAVRAALAKSVAEAVTFIGERGVAEESAPVLVRLIAQIAARFGVVVSEKVAAEALPVVGAAGGASINLLFIDHFQNVAQAHFTVRKLERKYGQDAVRAEYERIERELGL
jgi:hypothetical protein